MLLMCSVNTCWLMACRSLNVLWVGRGTACLLSEWLFVAGEQPAWWHKDSLAFLRDGAGRLAGWKEREKCNQYLVYDALCHVPGICGARHWRCRNKQRNKIINMYLRSWPTKPKPGEKKEVSFDIKGSSLKKGGRGLNCIVEPAVESTRYRMLELEVPLEPSVQVCYITDGKVETQWKEIKPLAMFSLHFFSAECTWVKDSLLSVYRWRQMLSLLQMFWLLVTNSEQEKPFLSGTSEEGYPWCVSFLSCWAFSQPPALSFHSTHSFMPNIRA